MSAFTGLACHHSLVADDGANFIIIITIIFLIIFIDNQDDRTDYLQSELPFEGQLENLEEYADRNYIKVPQTNKQTKNQILRKKKNRYQYTH